MRELLNSLRMAWGNLEGDNTRTVLSVLSICVGVFCVSVLYGVPEGLGKKMKHWWQLEEGKELLTVKNRYLNSGNRNEYLQQGAAFALQQVWDGIPYAEYLMLRDNLKNAEYVSSWGASYKSWNYRSYYESTTLYRKGRYRRVGLYFKTSHYPTNILHGRMISPYEERNKKRVLVLDKKTAKYLFPDKPLSGVVGEYVYFWGKEYRIVGVRKRTFGAYIPGTLIDEYGKTSRRIEAKRLPWDKDFSVLKAEIRGLLRASRGLKPHHADNFEIKTAGRSYSRGTQRVLSTLQTAGLIIGAFSLLIGGLGIASVMFASVSKQRFLIGLQKALGAKRWIILTQFLCEAVMLSFIGGVFGATATWLITFVEGEKFSLSFSSHHVILALGICCLVGIVSGLAPAYKASRLTPVQTLRD